MLNSPIVTAIFSIVFIFFIFSMMASLVNEYITGLTKKRGKFLSEVISKLLKDEFINQVDFGQIIYTHPLISGLKEKSDALPSYIPSDVFATALIDSVIDFTTEYSFTGQSNPSAPTTPLPVKDPNKQPDPYNDFAVAVREKLLESSLKKTFESFLINAANYNQLKENIEIWYGHYMDRVSGWYKKNTAKNMAIIGWAIAILFNVDTIFIFKTLKKNTALNYSIASAAQNYVSTNKGAQYDTVTNAQVQSLMALSDSLDFPVGYKLSANHSEYSQPHHRLIHGLHRQMRSDGGWLMLLIGWFISAMAIAKGAPFWFDILSKFVNVRMSGNKPPKPKSQKG